MARSTKITGSNPHATREGDYIQRVQKDLDAQAKGRKVRTGGHAKPWVAPTPKNRPQPQ